jgi:hypothetical protein
VVRRIRTIYRQKQFGKSGKGSEAIAMESRFAHVDGVLRVGPDRLLSIIVPRKGVLELQRVLTEEGPLSKRPLLRAPVFGRTNHQYFEAGIAMIIF